MVKWVKILGFAAVLCAFVGAAQADNNVQNMGTYKINGSTKQNVDASGNALVSEAAKDRDLDYYATAIATATMDTATVQYSAPIDLRKYTHANVIIHVAFGSADTTVSNLVDYAISAFPLPTLAMDWTGYGVPVPAFPYGNHAQAGAVNNMADTLGGFWNLSNRTSGQLFAGERMVRLAARPTAFPGSSGGTHNVAVNIAAGTTLSVPLSSLLAPGQRCRFLAIQLRCVSRASTAAPSVRVDIEALR